jgi:hypothetical protein
MRLPHTVALTDGDTNADAPVRRRRFAGWRRPARRDHRPRLALRLAAAGAAVAALSACAPHEIAAWVEWHNQDPEPAMAFALMPEIQEALTATSQAVRLSPPTSSGSGRCGQYHDMAISAGFSEADWSTVDRLMWRESGCNPGAYNRSGASGLMQIMKMWADDCGGTPSDLFNAWFNLRCAVHIKNISGWNAWSTY